MAREVRVSCGLRCDTQLRLGNNEHVDSINALALPTLAPIVSAVSVPFEPWNRDKHLPSRGFLEWAAHALDVAKCCGAILARRRQPRRASFP